MQSDIYKHLNASVLSGEYFINVSLAREFLEKIENFLKEEYKDTIREVVEEENLKKKVGENVLKDLEEIYFSDIQKTISNSIKLYQNLCIVATSESIKLDEPRKYVNATTYSSVSSKTILNADSSSHSDFFAINVFTSIIDANLTLDARTFKELYKYHSQLTDRSDSVDFSQIGYRKFLVDKINLLIRKILYRNEEESYKYHVADPKNNHDIEYQEFELKFLEEFDTKCRVHYEVNKEGKSFSYESITTKEIDEYTFEDYHTATKHFKDKAKDSSQLKNLFEEFKFKYKSNKKPPKDFNNLAYKVSQNYLYNNYLSALIDKESSYQTIVKSYDVVEKLQNKTFIYNYFPHFKYLKYNSKRLADLFSKDQETINRDEAELIVSKSLDAIKNLEKAYSWSEERDFLAFQLPFQDCLIDTGEDFYKEDTDSDLKWRVFVFTSFVLPINYEKVKQEKDDIIADLKSYKNQIRSQSSIDRQRDLIKKNLTESLRKEVRENISEEIKEEQRRTIQILSIFASIVVFASTVSVKFMIDAKKLPFEDFILSTLSFGVVLILFNYIIHLIVGRDSDKGGVSRSTFHSFIVGYSAVLIFLIILVLYKL